MASPPNPHLSRFGKILLTRTEVRDSLPNRGVCGETNNTSVSQIPRKVETILAKQVGSDDKCPTTR